MKHMIIFCTLIFTSLSVLAQKGGDLDTDFGSEGFSLLDFETDSSENAFDIIALNNGKIMTIGYILQSNNYDLLVGRINANGSKDLSFGQGGYVTIDLGSSLDRAFSGVELYDGKIVITGYTYQAGVTNGFILRLNANGSIDHSFGEGSKGYTLFNAGTKKTCYPDEILQYGGSFFVLANTLNNGDMDYSVYKFTQGGVLDQSFGNNGSVVLSVYGNDMAKALAISGEGKIALGGKSYHNGEYYAVIIQLNSSGSIDKTFNGNGLKEVQFETDDNSIEDLAYDQNNFLVAVGYEGLNPDLNGMFFRLKKNGDFDSTFGVNGTMFSDIGTSTSVIINNVDILQDNSIHGSGYLNQNGHSQVYSLILTHEGKPHPDFGTGGDVNYEFPIETESMFIRNGTIQKDGDLLLTGTYIPKGSGLNTIYVVRLHGPDFSQSHSVSLNPVDLKLYPNPASKGFYVEMPEAGLVKINMYNQAGIIVKTWNGNEGYCVLSDEIANGFYFIQIITESAIYTGRLVVER